MKGCKVIKATIKGLTVFSFILVLAASLFVAATYVLPSFAQSQPSAVESGPTHISFVVVTPGIIAPSKEYTFAAEVKNDISNMANINEFRILNNTLATSNPNEFTNFLCLPKSGWNGPTSLETEGYPYCLYTAQTGNAIAPNQSVTFEFNATSPPSDSCRTWRFDTRALDQTWNTPESVVCADAQAPITTKTFEGPQKLGNYGAEWIDGVTKVVLHPTDPQPHPSGVNITYWRNTLALSNDGSNDISPCYQPTNPFYCHSGPAPQDPFHPGDGWQVWNGSSVDKDQESCHILDYYSIDNMGNVEGIKTNCFFVDKTPPILTKDNGQAIPYTDPNPPIQGLFHYISPSMPITFTCEDQYPHPSGDEKLCFKVSFDKPQYPTDVTGLYASKYGVPVGQDGFACVPVNESKQFIFNFNKNENSTHDLKYYCKDAVEKKTNTHLQWYKVDDEPPQIIKTVGQPQVGDCSQDGQGPCYIRDHVTPIIIDVVDAGEHKSGLSYCEWSYTVNGDPVGRGTETQFPFQIIFPEDSTHVLTINCYDKLGNVRTDVETFLVDSIPPNTTKTYGKPFFKEYRECPRDGLGAQEVSPQWCSSWVEWINSSTPVYLNVTDNKVGVDKVYWRNMVIKNPEGWRVCEKADWYCSPRYYNQYIDNDTSWNVADGNTSFYKTEESCHVIEYYSVDKLGNTEPKKWQCPFVDNTHPNTTKTIGEPKVLKEELCQDNGAKGFGAEAFSVQSTGSLVGRVNFSVPCSSGTGVGITYDGQNLWYSCYSSPTDLYRADPLTGVVSKSYSIASGLGALAYDASRNAIWAGWGGPGTGKIRLIQLNGSKEVVSTSDVFASATNGMSIDDGLAYDAQDDTLYVSPDVSSTIYHYKTNGTSLGSFAPAGGSSNSGLAIGGDLMYQGYNGLSKVLVVNKSATSVVVFNFSTVIPGDPNFRDEDLECDTNTFANIGKHVMWSVEAYEPRRASAFEIPFGSCGIGGTRAACGDGHLDPGEECDDGNNVNGDGCSATCRIERPGGCQNNVTTYITSRTPITLSCEDGQPHPVDHVSLFYRYRVSDDCKSWNEDNWTSWIDPNGHVVTKKIYLPQDSCHQVEYYCVDALGNKEPTKTETDIVDNQPPVIRTSIDGPHVGDCSQNFIDGDLALNGDHHILNNSCIIDGVTKIHVDATDPQPHPVDDVTCSWTYRVREDGGASGGGINGSSFDINFPEESTHDLWITCKDALNNTNSKYEIYHVDKTPPVTNKTYGQPFYSNGISEWISNITPITLIVDDAGPHKSGINATYWRTTMVDDTYCNGINRKINDTLDCSNAQGNGLFDKATPKLVDNSVTFTIPEQSCHLIEYYSVDNVNKTELAKRQCAFVDNMAPLPNKTVGQPKEVWDGKDAKFYNITEFCQTPGNCWNVTVLTPITLDCKDPDPHPVDNSKVWFKVDLDGDDKTQYYCEDEKIGIHGRYDNETGYCLIGEKQAPVTFFFKEESEHNLKFFCQDALGNRGPVDDEKFKVRGAGFNITINKKWNLISTPFTLLSDSMHSVFDPHNDTIISVWTYDPTNATCGQNWCIFTPDGINNDDIASMVPGSGYWVLANGSTSLLIGGGLFSPVITPPDKQLVKGWNLIGYYGNDNDVGDPKTAYPSGEPPSLHNGKQASCELHSLVDTTIGYPRWSSLWSYWEPRNPDQWIPFDVHDNMDAGAGYWIEMDVPDLYAPSTTCGGFA